MANNPVDKHVGQRLRLRRTLRGLTQVQLADELGLTFQQVQKYERGANRIGASRLFDVARVLDISIGYFFEEMPQDIARRSPARLKGEQLADGADSDSPFNKRETIELVRAYYAVRDQKVRKHVVAVLRALGGEPLEHFPICENRRGFARGPKFDGTRGLAETGPHDKTSFD